MQLVQHRLGTLHRLLLGDSLLGESLQSGRQRS